MTILMIVSAVLMVLSVYAICSALQMSPVAESGQVGSIILFAGGIGAFVALILFGVVVGMTVAGVRP